MVKKIFKDIRKEIYNKFIIEKEKKPGRIPKNNLVKGKNKRKRKDDENKKNWRNFFNLIINSLNDIINDCNSKEEKKIDFLKNTNFEFQFRPDDKKDYSNFINKTLYEFLIYNPPPNPKNEDHRYIGSYNAKIIKEMKSIKRTQAELFCQLLELEIKTIHSIFIQEKKLFIKKNMIYLILDY